LLLVGFLAAATNAPAIRGMGFLINPHGQVFYSNRSQVFGIDPELGAEIVLENRPAQRLLLDTDGNLCGEIVGYNGAADVPRPSIWRLHPDGRVVELPASSARTAYAFSDVVDSQGRLYFWEGDPARGARSRILTRRKDAEPLLLAGHDWGWRDGRGVNARLGNVGAMVLGPADSFYFSDDGAVRRIEPDGTVLTLARGGLLGTEPLPRHRRNPLTALTVDSSGQIYVVHTDARRVFRVATDGSVTTLATSENGWTPTGIVWCSGRLLVLESGPRGVRAMRCTPDGRLTPLPGQPDATAATQPAPLWRSS
jgi:hypothetical protein